MDLPTPLRVQTLNYLGETQEELRTVTVLSKQFNEDCKQNGIEWNIIPTIIVSPLKHNGGQQLNLFRNLRDKNRLLQRYRLMIIKNVHIFHYPKSVEDRREIQRITDTFRMGILSLDISLSSPSTIGYYDDLPCHLSCILPNLHEVDLSYTDFKDHVLEGISRNCPRLEKIAWNNIRYGSHISINGEDMQVAKNLRVLIADDSVFSFYKEEMSDFNNHPDKFLFHECCKVLE